MAIIEVKSEKNPDAIYLVDTDAKTCTCPDFTGRRVGTGQFCKHLRATIPPKLKDLGWANGYVTVVDGKAVYWPEVEACEALGHKPTDVDKGPPNRGLDHVITCEACGIVYHVDSSD